MLYDAGTSKSSGFDDRARSQAVDTVIPATAVDRVDPWQEFLRARIRVVEWLAHEYNWSDTQISRQLSLGAGQVSRMRPAADGERSFGGADTDTTMAAPLDD